MKRFIISLVVFISVMGFGHAYAAATFYGPTQYFSFSDSPYSTGQFNYFYLENFEDGLLMNVNYFSRSTTIKIPAELTQL